MKKVLTFALTLACAFLSTSCSRPEVEPVEVQKEAIYSEGFDVVWTAVVSIFAEFDIPVSNMEKESGFVNCNDVRVPEEWLIIPEGYIVKNCRASFNVFVTEIEGGCKVAVTASFYADVTKWAPFVGFYTAEQEPFLSSGIFEERFHIRIAERLSQHGEPGETSGG